MILHNLKFDNWLNFPSHSPSGDGEGKKTVILSEAKELQIQKRNVNLKLNDIHPFFYAKTVIK
jgi:hypothetical protein